jgi:hypothetical protein
MPPADEFDTIIQRAIDLPAAPAATPAPRRHRLLLFAAGTGLWLVDGMLLYLFVWLLLHG